VVPRRGRLKRLQDDIFGVPECAALQAPIDDRLHFRVCDLNIHGAASFVVPWPRRLRDLVMTF
jgi:hypothetical protein